MKKTNKKAIASVALALGLIIPQAAPTISYADVVSQDVVKLRILETSDIHTNILDYNYFTDKQDNTLGLSKVATLIKKAREEEKNTLLFDNGDLIQGNPLGDYMAANLKDGQTHPAIKALNFLNYDASTLGNHEFNYGLDYLNETYDDAKFDVVNANVYHDDKDSDPSNDKNYFTPYKIQEKQVVDADGQSHTIKVGVIGFVPPDILKWDKDKLEGKVIAKDIIDSANEFIPKMKADGADLVVVLAHTGISFAEYEKGMENAGYYLTQIKGIDAVLTGHNHLLFPAAPGASKQDFKDSDTVDNAKGTMNGVPVTMPGSYGNNLGVIDLTIEKVDGKWAVKDSKASLRNILDQTNPDYNKPVFWKGKPLKKNQIGKINVTKDINLWKREGDKLVFVRVLKAGEGYRVYNFDGKHGGQYGVGDDYYVTNMKSNIKYETPTKAKIQLANAPEKIVVANDPAIEQQIKAEHEATLAYVRGPVGETTSPINSYLALVKDDPSIQIVTNAQKWYIENKLKGTVNENIPVLSAGAPFKAGGRGGVNAYTDIATGTIAIKNVADLYLYSNTVYAVKVKGEDIKNWLEWSAGQFKQVDPANKETQELVNLSFPTYSFDIIDGVTYEIDVTEPTKYDKDQNLVNANANRIKNLMYNGAPVTSDQEFIVATNNYRANGLKLAPSKEIVLASPDENRQVIIDYIAMNKTINPSVDNNWSFAPIKGSEGVKVSFESAPKAQEFITKDSGITYVNTLESGFAKYELTLPALK